ncbi:MAG TPA: AAA family ATPase, partial [Bacteroidales bacterium]|nr:AAA family ATPase [Bacteroidales bacterium]
KISPETLYISLDDLYFSQITLSDLAELFVIRGGKHLFIDEVHKYPGWSRELKNIYDFYPELQMVVTGSSMLEIFKGEADLSRRASVYIMNELSFREYLHLMHKIKVPVVALKDILQNHIHYEIEINQKIKPLKYFGEYLKQGVYPFIVTDKALFYEKLENIIHLIVENDLPASTSISYETVTKIKKLLYLISTSVPFKPNITELSRKLQTSRDQLLKYLFLLENAGLIHALHRPGIATSMLTKPDKIYLNNTALMYALDERVNPGTLRETFFLNQVSAKHNVAYSVQGDFLVDNIHTIEVGGQNKTFRQIAGMKDSYIAADDMEYGYQNKIPLWLFGCTY